MNGNDDSKYKRLRTVCILFALALACHCIGAKAEDGFPRVQGPCDPTFPRDHGPHPDYKTEWWYYTGNLSDGQGRRFGFQLTFFRSRLGPEEYPEKLAASKRSAWRTNQIFLAHAALSDIGSKEHFHAEKTARQALGIAGATAKDGVAQVFLKDWSADMGEGEHRLKAQAREFSLDLSLVPLKAPVPHGDRGYSRKGVLPESASCYYSMTRMQASGTVGSGGRVHRVEGFAWMDHEFSTNPLEPDLAGWDWFGIQLDNHTELMVYFLRKKAGGIAEASSGTFVDPSGKSTSLRRDQIAIEVVEFWKSKASKANYPSAWKMSIPSLGLRLSISANLPDQEMQTPHSTSVTYWEGSVSASGYLGHDEVEGSGYAELTGYDRAMDSPM